MHQCSWCFGGIRKNPAMFYQMPVHPRCLPKIKKKFNSIEGSIEQIMFIEDRNFIKQVYTAMKPIPKV